MRREPQENARKAPGQARRRDTKGAREKLGPRGSPFSRDRHGFSYKLERDSDHGNVYTPVKAVKFGRRSASKEHVR